MNAGHSLIPDTSQFCLERGVLDGPLIRWGWVVTQVVFLHLACLGVPDSRQLSMWQLHCLVLTPGQLNEAQTPTCSPPRAAPVFKKPGRTIIHSFPIVTAPLTIQDSESLGSNYLQKGDQKKGVVSSLSPRCHFAKAMQWISIKRNICSHVVW